MLIIKILLSKIKEIIPKQNTDLANQISINGGLIISNYKDALNFKEQMSGYV
jgi:predicted Rossmann fold nucleotide-binding protein DprA/Smf involved in DNA uptake